MDCCGVSMKKCGGYKSVMGYVVKFFQCMKCRRVERLSTDTFQKMKNIKH